MRILDTTADVLKGRLHTARGLSERSDSIDLISGYSKLIASFGCALESVNALDFEDRIAIDAQLNQLISRIPTPENKRALRDLNLIADALDALLVLLK